MNLTALRTFAAIVETGSLVRASERLNVTQSTVTARLKGLEEELGQTLIHRQKSGATLTAAGMRLKRYADAMMDLWRQARQEISLPEGIVSVCNMGCPTDLWPAFGQRIMDLMRRRHPDIALSAWPAAHAELEHWLGSGVVDVALSYQPMTGSGQTSTPLTEERLIVVSDRADGPLRFDPGYIFVDAGEEFGRRHAAAYADAGVAKVSFGSSAWALDHLLEHGGSAYLPERLAAPHLAAGRLFHLAEGPVFTRRTYLILNDLAAADWPWLADLAAEAVSTA